MQHSFKERDWDQFHSPKNLAINLAVEVGELLEHFRWLTEESSANLSEETHKKAFEEIGDVFITLLAIAEKLNIDCVEAGENTLDKLDRRYPASECRGKSLKYTAYNKPQE
jgi:NTP pyrophosphatase (non-canonical NTP hydrolase)